MEQKQPEPATLEAADRLCGLYAELFRVFGAHLAFTIIINALGKVILTGFDSDPELCRRAAADAGGGLRRMIEFNLQRREQKLDS
jgi:hypothetical protein